MVPEEGEDGKASADDAAGDFGVAVLQTVSQRGLCRKYIYRADKEYLPQKTGLHVDIREVLCPYELDFEEDAHDAANARTKPPVNPSAP